MRPLEESLLNHRAARGYIMEELGRRGLSFLERQNFFAGRKIPYTAEPEALDAWLDRELGLEAERHE